MVALLVAALLTQAAPADGRFGIAVLVSRRDGLSPLEGAQLAARMADALAAADLPLARTPAELDRELGQDGALGCRGRPDCLAGLARQVGAAGAVGLEAAAVFGDLALQLVLVDAHGGPPLLERTIVLPPDKLNELDQGFADFAKAARPLLENRPGFAPRPPPPDAPKVAQLTPAVSPPPAAVAVTPKPAPVLAWSFTAAGVAAAAAAGYFGYAGYGAYQTHQAGLRTLEGDPRMGSPLTRAQFDQMNRDFTIAAAGGALSAALLSGAVYFWSTGPR